MSNRVLISLPIYRREWIVNKWLDCIKNQSIGLQNIGFQFEMGPDDLDTEKELFQWFEKNPEVFMFDVRVDHLSKHSAHDEGKRAWKRDEYHRMVNFRNNLLDRASGQTSSFDFLFSLDSDILLEDNKTIEKLITHDKEVISPLSYMTPRDTNCPNYMFWKMKGSKTESFLAHRTRSPGGLIKVDVPMASVMMRPNVVEKIRYKWHPQGEDIGFATELYKAKIDSFVDQDIYCPHVMHRQDFKTYMESGDQRSLINKIA